MKHQSILILTLGALLTAPLFSQTLDPVIREGQVQWWKLTETTAEVRAAMGPPTQVAELEGYLSWQHRLPGVDHESDVSSQMLFRRSTGQLASVTRSYEEDRDVSELFPGSETTLHQFPNEHNPTFRVLIRRLSGGRLLIASGLASGPGWRSAQLVLLREMELAQFFPWIKLAAH